ncbi:S1 family peptidase [Longispora sp. NPDC051575]|uniref:S1 family peptidase n=1 Tax=Longispora sp. NPDC051575 TaxID=3154943 RepID=UPI003414D9A2
MRAPRGTTLTLRTLAALAAGTTLLSLAAVPAAASPGATPTDATARLMARQRVLVAGANTIRWAVERTAAPGYGSIELASDQVIVHWKGLPPAPVADAIDSARRTVDVRVVPAAHSHAELRAAGLRLAADIDRAVARADYDIRIAPDGSGLTLATDAPELLGDPGLLATGVPVRHERAGAHVPLATRENDIAPWSGGARTRNWSPALGMVVTCTSGFGVTSGAGYHYLLTAAHCMTPPDAVYDGNSDWIGTADRENWQHDVILVRAYGTTSGRIFDGGVNSNWGKGVSGWDWAYQGQWLCDSGATTGVHCGIQITNLSVRTCSTNPDSDGDYNCYNDLVSATRRDGGTVGDHGDSGGPVFSLDGSFVRAIGVISGRDSSRQNVLFFQDFGTAWRDFGVNPVTSGW